MYLGYNIIDVPVAERLRTEERKLYCGCEQSGG